MGDAYNSKSCFEHCISYFRCRTLENVGTYKNINDNERPEYKM